MRYSGVEPPIAVAVLPTGGTVTVQVLHLETNALLTLDNANATESPVAGLWTYPLSNVNEAAIPDGFAQLVIAFTHSGGTKDYAKMIVHGYPDDVRKIRKMVATVV